MVFVFMILAREMVFVFMILSLDGLCFHDFVALNGICFHDFVARWSLSHNERFLQQSVFSRNIIMTNTSVFCRTQTLRKNK